MMLVISRNAFGPTTAMVYSLSRRKISLSRIGFSNVHEACRAHCLSRGIAALHPWRGATIETITESHKLKFSVSTQLPSPSLVFRSIANAGNFISSWRTPTTTKKESSNSEGSVLDSSTSSSIIIYPNSVGSMNSFDSYFNGAFSYPGSQVHMTHISTSSALYTSQYGYHEHSFGRLNHSREQPEQKIKLTQIDLTEEEEELFHLLRTVTTEYRMKTTLRVAGGWVRDKILASKEFKRNRVYGDSCHSTCVSRVEEFGGSKSENHETGALNRNTFRYKGENSVYASSPPDKSLSVTVPVDIDIALDDKLGREFADELNQWLSAHGRETHSVGVVLKNPEKSKHLETATMRVNNYWIDFVNLRAEEYTSDSRIPDLMRIGTAEEDALRRDLTINSLFYNINEGVVEDMTGQGLYDLCRGVVATPLLPLTTLLDDPLRVLRSVRFAARLCFGMEDSLKKAAADPRVKTALEQKVSRERVGSEVDLMLKSRDPVRAMRLLVHLGLIETVFPPPEKVFATNREGSFNGVFHDGLALLGTTHDHLCDCKANPPVWCEVKRALDAGAVNGVGKEATLVLMDDEDARRLLWYAAFLKPLRDRATHYDKDFKCEKKKTPKKADRSVVLKLLVDGLKRPIREAESVEKIMKAADEFTMLVSAGSDLSSALPILLSGVHVFHAKGEFAEGEGHSKIVCTMDNRGVDSDREDDPVWKHCMEFRQNCADVLRKIEPLWRAAFVLSLCEQVTSWKNNEIEYLHGGDVVQEAPEEVINGIIKNYNVFAAAMMQLGLIGIWNQHPLLNGDEIKNSILPNIPKGPVFRDVMDAQTQWMTSHPGGRREKLVEHLQIVFPEFV
eukprot:CAMPEP_0172326938 /NCGR_PEP_ID=MMETSP1058-20130122/58057_1 /TAXON_ID=83371 /ORGANISM="Detonula confervacea, Strain CCMP 353" /LENGTH=844 /DNA_ID=CAMNT_0013043845 /DNA_START=142 /DNA_END=2676 /DNA_ORIENTATION=+